MSKILITGCSSGFGLETAKLFLDRDWEVVATMRNAQRRAAADFRAPARPAARHHRSRQRRLGCRRGRSDRRSGQQCRLRRAVADRTDRARNGACLVRDQYAGHALDGTGGASGFPRAPGGRHYQRYLVCDPQATASGRPVPGEQGGGERLHRIAGGGGEALRRARTSGPARSLTRDAVRRQCASRICAGATIPTMRR